MTSVTYMESLLPEVNYFRYLLQADGTLESTDCARHTCRLVPRFYSPRPTPELLTDSEDFLGLGGSPNRNRACVPLMRE